MSAIQPKKGKCVDCGPEAPDQYLTAKRCKTHYWAHRLALRNVKRKANGVNLNAYQDKQDLDEWFLFQVSNMPAKCECCGEPLIKFAKWAAKSYIAHILPKRHFNSVRLHVLNRLYLCLQCHGNYDNRGWKAAMTMKVWPLALERLKAFVHLIPTEEIKHLPEPLLNMIAA